MTILDSGCTGHYFSANTSLPNLQPTKTPVTVTVANNQTITSTHTADLPLPHLPPMARKVHVFPALGTNLVGVTPLTQAGCTVHFEGSTCTIQCPDSNTLTCHATPMGLWAFHIDARHGLTTTEQPAAMAATGATPSLGNSCTPADIVAFHHAALFSPAISTLRTALQKGFIPPLPGLTETLLRKYTPDLEATAMGHLDNHRKNVQSTQRPIIQTIGNDDPFPTSPDNNRRTHHCYITAEEPKHILYSNQTGKLPHPSTNGNKYLLIAYDFDSNNILLRPYKNKSAEVLTATIKHIHDSPLVRQAKRMSTTAT